MYFVILDSFPRVKNVVAKIIIRQTAAILFILSLGNNNFSL
jgi:hypothetical protein